MSAAAFYLRRDRSLKFRTWLFQGLGVALGIAALATLEIFSGRIENTIRRDSRNLLAADYQIQAWRDFDESVLSAVHSLVPKEGVIQQTDFVATIRFGADQALTVSARAIEGAYPFYGNFRTQPQVTAESLRGDPRSGILLDPIFEARGVKIGDAVKLGAHDFEVRGFVLEEPQTVGGAFALGPRVILHQAAAAQTELIGPTSRAFRMLLLKTSLPYAEFRAAFRARVPDVHWRLISPERANRQAGQVIDRITGFLSLVALTAVFLGGAGLFMIFRARYLVTLPQILTLRCLGLSTRALAFSASLQGFGIALLGWVLGFLGGWGVEAFVSRFATAQLGVTLSEASYGTAALRSFAVALLMVGLAVLVPLRQVLRIPVNAALRDADAQNLRVSAGDAGALVGVVVLLAALVGRDPKLAGVFLIGFALVLVLLAVLARGLAWIGRGGLVRRPLPLRHAFLGFSRQGASTQVLVVTMGLAAFLPSTVYLLSRALESQMDLSHRIGVPNLFLLNVPPETRPALDKEAENIDFVPVTQARLVSVKGVPIEELKIPQRGWNFSSGQGSEREESLEAPGERGEGDIERVRFTREYFVSRRLAPTVGERLLGGATQLFGPKPADGAVRVSIEEGFASALDVKPQDRFEVEIAGVKLPAMVSSLRKADWFNFRPNFFLVFHPDDIEGAPFEYVGVVQVPAADVPQWQRRLTEKFPNITVLDGESLSRRLRSLLGQLSVAIYAVGSFAVGSALLVFLGIVLARRASKMREISLWRCLGLDDRRALALLGLEIGISGAAAGVIAAGASLGFSAMLCRMVFDIPFEGVGAWLVTLSLLVGLPLGLGLLGAWLLRPVLSVPAARLFQTAEESAG